MLEEFYRSKLHRYHYGEVWVRVGDWQSNTTMDLICLDVGTDQPPISRTEALYIPGRVGYIIQERHGCEPYKREMVFHSRTPKARRKLHERIQTGREYDFILSTDPAYYRPGFVQSAEDEKATRNDTFTRFEIIQQPFKTSRELSEYKLTGGTSTITHPGNFKQGGLLTLSGKTGAQTITINGEGLTVDVPAGGLVLDCDRFEAYAPGGTALQNSRIQRGFFPQFAPGNNAINLPAGLSCVVSVRWRFRT